MLKRQSEILTREGSSSTPRDIYEYPSAEQYRQITALAEELEVDPDRASKTLFEVPVEALSASGADDLIAYLKNLRA